MSASKYVFTETQDAQELNRLQALEQIFDVASHHQLQSTGLTTNWTCLEVGAGAGSIAQWMTGIVGQNGKVVAVDLDTRFVSNLAADNLEVLAGDIRHLPIENQTFDLVHTRYVLIHIPDWHQVLSKLIALVKPGGWIVLEEPDFATARAIVGEQTDCQSVNKVNQAILRMFADRDMDYSLGVKLPAILQTRGLEASSVEVDMHLSRGGSNMATMMSMSTMQLADKYIATGEVTPVDIERYGHFAADPNAWGIYYATARTIAQTAVPASSGLR